ncbi:phosphatase PAP2 family protein [Tardiphaga sp.]|uniref:phosphatase PAP2 family protein n=1 Tax=Tardiphaga sp. TaxID=1926292 RepID=UPI0037D9B390
MLSLSVLFAVTVSSFGAMTAYIGQTLKLPLQDATFVAIDRSLGFDWHSIVCWTDLNPIIARTLEFVHATIGFQIALPILVLAFLNRLNRLRVYLAGMSLAILLTVVIGSLLPAAGLVGGQFGANFSVLQFSGATPLQHLEILRASAK